MRVIVVLLNAMPLHIMNGEMNEWVLEETEKKAVQNLFNFFVFMTLWAYFTASFSRPQVIPRVDSQHKESKTCLHCNNWKPERTHHCSVCKMCVAKMDHHCPWLGNCVGFHNFKTFFLFCVYQACTGMVYCRQLVFYAFYSPDEAPRIESQLGIFCFWMTNTFGMLISFALLPLSARVLFQIYNNVTSIEMIHNV